MTIRQRLLTRPRLYRGVRAIYRVIFRPHWLVKQAIRRAGKNGIFDSESEMEMASHCPKSLLDLLLRMYAPTSVIDIGAGTGQAVAYLLENGITNVCGLEGSRLAISKSKYPGHMICQDLRRQVDLRSSRYDVVWSYEVAEHLHPDHADNLVRIMTTLSDLVVMSAAQPGQGGEGHLNEQPPLYWIRKFKQRGFALREADTEEFRRQPDPFARNMMVFALTQ